MLSATNIATVLLVRQWEIVPFDLVWGSLAVLIGLRVWTVRTAVAVLAGVIVATGLPLIYTVVRGLEPVAELSEWPLIAGIFVAVIWHVHRYQSAMAELGRLAEAQREFVRDASHELRTPITVAAGHAELILTSSDPKAAADADIVLEELERLSRLSERLLLLAATGHPEFLRTRPIELGPFLEATATRWRATAARSWGLELERREIHPKGRPDHAGSDRGRWPSCDRDLRHGARDPSRSAGPCLKRFARTDDSRIRSNGGTGLGLAIVKAIVEAHRGSVSLRSGAGRGASFRITLPGFEPRGPAGSGPPIPRVGSVSPPSSP